MDNKFILGLCIIGFGILLLFSRADYSIWFSAIAVGIGSGIIITKKDKKEDRPLPKNDLEEEEIEEELDEDIQTDQEIVVEDDSSEIKSDDN